MEKTLKISYTFMSLPVNGLAAVMSRLEITNGPIKVADGRSSFIEEHTFGGFRFVSFRVRKFIIYTGIPRRSSNLCYSE